MNRLLFNAEKITNLYKYFVIFCLKSKDLLDITVILSFTVQLMQFWIKFKIHNVKIFYHEQIWPEIDKI